MSEKNTDEIEERFWSLRNPIAWGLGITLLFIGFVFVLAVGSYCTPNICLSRLEVFLASKPNEIGDTLAGISSTIAFVWIVVTVWIQSLELREQRRELKAQRKEFEQVNISMLQQTKIFEGEERKRRHNSVFSTMNARLRAMLDALNEEVGQLRWEGRDLSTGEVHAVDLVPDLITVDRTKDDYPVNDASLVKFSKLIGELCKLVGRSGEIQLELRPKKSFALQSLLDISREILSVKKEDMSENSANRIKLMQLDDMHSQIERLLINQQIWA